MTILWQYLGGLALQVMENLVFEPVSILRVVLVGVWVEDQTADVVQIVDVLVEVGNVVCNVLNSGIQLLQLVLVHFDNSCTQDNTLEKNITSTSVDCHTI